MRMEMKTDAYEVIAAEALVLRGSTIGALDGGDCHRQSPTQFATQRKSVPVRWTSPHRHTQLFVNEYPWPGQGFHFSDIVVKSLGLARTRVE